MSNSKFRTWKALLPALFAGYVVGTLVIWFIPFVMDQLHSRLPCSKREKDIARSIEPQTFERVSSFWWTSLCRPEEMLLVISASEGTGGTEEAPEQFLFPRLFIERGFPAYEFTAAHRGIKTLAYLLAHDIHADRLDGLNIVAFVNPV